MLLACSWHVASMLPACCQYVASILAACCWLFACMWLACGWHVASMLEACCQYVEIILPSMFQRKCRAHEEHWKSISFFWQQELKSFQSFSVFHLTIFAAFSILFNNTKGAYIIQVPQHQSKKQQAKVSRPK